MRLSECIKRFLQARSLELAPKSLKDYEHDLELFMGYVHSQAQDSVLVLDSKLIDGYLIGLSRRGLSMATLARRRAVLNSFAQWGMRERYFYADPMAHVQKIRVKEQPPKPFDGPERERLMALELSGLETTLRGILYYAGLRVSEAITLKVGDFASEAKTLRVKGKGNKERVVPIPAELAGLLTEWILGHTDLHPGTHLFPRGVAGHINVPTAQYLCRKWGNKANVQGVTPHRFRHDYATRLLARGADVRTIQKLMGHATIATTAHYLSVNDRQLREAADLLSERPISVENYLQPPTTRANPPASGEEG